MTNAQAAALFASLPPDEDAEILLVNGDTASAERELLLEPTSEDADRIRDEVEDDFRTVDDDLLPIVFLKW